MIHLDENKMTTYCTSLGEMYEWGGFQKMKLRGVPNAQQLPILGSEMLNWYFLEAFCEAGDK